MRNETLKCTRNAFAKYYLHRHSVALLSKGDFIVNSNPTPEP